MSAPGPPLPPPVDLDGGLGDIEIDFIQPEFWMGMVAGAVKVCVNCLVAALLWLIFMLIIKALLRVLKMLLNNPKRPVPEQLTRLIIVSLKLVLWMQIIPILVNRIGIAVDSMVAVVTAIALTIGMSMKSNAENFVAGVALMLEKDDDHTGKIELGDMVELGGIKGKITTLGLALTTVQEPDGNVVHIPNMKLFSGPMTNFSSPGRARIDVKFRILPSVTMKKVRAVMLEVLRQHPLVMSEPAPTVILIDVKETAMIVAARVWVEPDKIFGANFPIREALHAALQSRRMLAFFRASVGHTLEQLEHLGYPGLSDDAESDDAAGDGADDTAAADKSKKLTDEVAQISVVV